MLFGGYYDNGDTWEFVTSVQGLRGQPALYELPRKMGEFSAGTIMAAGMSANPPLSASKQLSTNFLHGSLFGTGAPR